MSLPLDAGKTTSRTLGPPAKDARVAVLLLHGFTGTPWEVQPLAEALAARGAHVRVPRLPGHGTIPEDLLYVTARDWEDAARRELEGLSDARRVVVAGLSMGALLGVLLAAQHPTRVQGLVLLAPAVRLKDRGARALRLLRHRRATLVKDRWVAKDSVDLDDAAERRAAPLLERFPAARLFDLFALQDAVSAVWTRLHVPTLVVGAVNDHVVDFEGVDSFRRARSGVEFLRLERSFHQLCRDRDRALVLAEVCAFVDRLAP